MSGERCVVGSVLYVRCVILDLIGRDGVMLVAVNELRRMVAEYAKSIGVCTQCFSHPAVYERVQCKGCIELNKRKRHAREALVRRNKDTIVR